MSPYERHGIECREGWKGLYEPLLQACEQVGAKVGQVKQKYGGLRFYLDSGPDWLYTMAGWAEDLSLQTCEVCGAHKDYGTWRSLADKERGKTVRTRSYDWVQTLCDPCAQAFEAETGERENQP